MCTTEVKGAYLARSALKLKQLAQRLILTLMHAQPGLYGQFSVHISTVFISLTLKAILTCLTSDHPCISLQEAKPEALEHTLQFIFLLCPDDALSALFSHYVDWSPVAFGRQMTMQTIHIKNSTILNHNHY